MQGDYQTSQNISKPLGIRNSLTRISKQDKTYLSCTPSLYFQMGKIQEWNKRKVDIDHQV